MSSLAAVSPQYPTNYGQRREALRRAQVSTRRPLKLVVPADVAQARPIATQKKGRAAIAALFAVATVLHIGVYAVLGEAGPAPAPIKKANPIAIDLAPPPPPPPPPPEPPKPQPQVAKVPTPAPAKAPPPPLPVVAEASDGPADANTVQVSNTPQPPAPPAPAPAPPPPPPPEPVTEPRGYAGYLKNPAPEYPLVAQERGMQGRVVLKVHVLASGKPDSVTVESSTGFKILDDAAVKAVLAWSFDPAKRGSTPIDGWVKVPLSFKL